jgi:coenzyme F420-reducing hydrogenase gamma subunit
MRLRYDLPETSVIQLLLEVKACIFTVGEPTEVFFSLYCHEFQERITEEFKVDYTFQGMPKDERFMTSSIQTIFRDVKEKYYMRNLYLICKIYRKGKLILDMDKVGTRKPTSKEEGIRRPFGVAVLDLTPPM